MAFNRDATIFSLKEPSFVKIGTITSPAALDPQVTDPDSLFTPLSGTGDVGYIERGSIALNLNDTHAEFLNATPGKVIRHDLTMRDWRMVFNLGQWGFDQVGTFQNMLTFTGGTRVGAYGGTDVPTPVIYAWRFDLTLTDDTVRSVLLYSFKIITADNSRTWSGDAHATIPVELRGFPEPNIEALGVATNDQKNILIEWQAA